MRQTFPEFHEQYARAREGQAHIELRRKPKGSLAVTMGPTTYLLDSDVPWVPPRSSVRRTPPLTPTLKACAASIPAQPRRNASLIRTSIPYRPLLVLEQFQLQSYEPPFCGQTPKASEHVLRRTFRSSSRPMVPHAAKNAEPASRAIRHSVRNTCARGRSGLDGMATACRAPRRVTEACHRSALMAQRGRIRWQPRSKGLSKDPLQKLAAIHSKPASPRKLGMARVSALRRQSQQPVVKLAAATVNRRVVGSSPT